MVWVQVFQFYIGFATRPWDFDFRARLGASGGAFWALWGLIGAFRGSQGLLLIRVLGLLHALRACVVLSVQAGIGVTPACRGPGGVGSQRRLPDPVKTDLGSVGGSSLFRASSVSFALRRTVPSTLATLFASSHLFSLVPFLVSGTSRRICFVASWVMVRNGDADDDGDGDGDDAQSESPSLQFQASQKGGCESVLEWWWWGLSSHFLSFADVWRKRALTCRSVNIWTKSDF